MKRNAILHCISAICGGLVFAFFALPYYTIKTVIPQSQLPAQLAQMLQNYSNGSESWNGYNFIKDALDKGHGSSQATFATVMAIITLVVAGIVFVCSILAFLNDVNVIKGEKVGSIFGWLALCSSLILALSVILNLVANNVFLTGSEFDGLKTFNDFFGAAGASMSAIAGWALTIPTTLLGLCSCCANTIAKFKK